MDEREAEKVRRGHRRRNNPPTKARCVYLTDEQVKLLRMYGRGDLSAGLRWLIDAAAPMVVKPLPPPPRSSE